MEGKYDEDRIKKLSDVLRMDGESDLAMIEEDSDAVRVERDSDLGKTSGNWRRI